MEIKSFEDVIKLHKELGEKFARQIEALATERPPKPEALLEQKTRELERAKARLKAASGEREEALRRIDVRIEREKKEAAQLEKEIEEMRVNLKRAAGKPLPDKPAGGEAKAKK